MEDNRAGRKEQVTGANLLLDIELLRNYDGIDELRYTSHLNRLMSQYIGQVRHYKIILLSSEPTKRIDKRDLGSADPWPNFCRICGELATHIHFSTGGCCGSDECCAKLSEEQK